MRRVVLMALLLAAVAVPAARADGDPASDVLYGQDLFLPYSSQVSKPLAAQLRSALARVRARGGEVRVALIASPIDLGAVSSLFGKPQRYARFLDMELRFDYPGNLLVVMPQGAALARNGKLLLLAPVRVTATADGLATAALAIVVRLTPPPPAPRRRTTDVTPRPRPAGPAVSRLPSGSWIESGPLTVAVAVAAPLAIVVAGLLLVQRRRRRDRVHF